MVDREVDWPVWVVLGRLGVSVCGRGPLLGPMFGGLRGGLGAYVGDLGPLLGLYWRSWAALGAALCGPGPLLERMWAVWGRKMRRT